MSVQGSIIRYITAMVIVGLAVLTAATFHGARKEIGQALSADSRAAAYFERHSEPDCRFQGAWHDWELDEWMTLSCLKVKVQHREGSYSSATGPRATLQVSMQGTYWIDGASIIHVARTVKGKITISACRSRSKMPSTLRRYVSRRPPKGLNALRSSFGRRMNKFFTTALNTVSIVPPSQTKLSEDRLPAVPEVDA